MFLRPSTIASHDVLTPWSLTNFLAVKCKGKFFQNPSIPEAGVTVEVPSKHYILVFLPALCLLFRLNKVFVWANFVFANFPSFNR